MCLDEPVGDDISAKLAELKAAYDPPSALRSRLEAWLPLLDSEAALPRLASLGSADPAPSTRQHSRTQVRASELGYDSDSVDAWPDDEATAVRDDPATNQCQRHAIGGPRPSLLPILHGNGLRSSWSSLQGPRAHPSSDPNPSPSPSPDSNALNLQHITTRTVSFTAGCQQQQLPQHSTAELSHCARIAASSTRHDDLLAGSMQRRTSMRSFRAERTAAAGGPAHASCGYASGSTAAASPASHSVTKPPTAAPRASLLPALRPPA